MSIKLRKSRELRLSNGPQLCGRGAISLTMISSGCRKHFRKEFEWLAVLRFATPFTLAFSARLSNARLGQWFRQDVVAVDIFLNRKTVRPCHFRYDDRNFRVEVDKLFQDTVC